MRKLTVSELFGKDKNGRKVWYEVAEVKGGKWHWCVIKEPDSVTALADMPYYGTVETEEKAIDSGKEWAAKALEK